MVALLNEVYGEDYLTSSSNVFPSEFYESHEDMIEDMSDDDIYHSYQQEIKKQEKKEIRRDAGSKGEKKIETFSNVITCTDIESHFNNCTRCQQKMKNRYSKLDDSKKKMIDIVMFLLIGILLLFILVIFVRLGKMLK